MDIVTFIKSFPLRVFQKHELLLHPDEAYDQVLIVREGFVKVTSTDTDGVERLLWIAGRYDIVPSEGVLNLSAITQYTYTAHSAGSAYVVPKADLLQLAREDAGVMAQIAQALGEHYDELLARINSLQQSGLRRRIVLMLDTLAQKFSVAEVVHLHELGLNISHQDIADMVHGSREAVSIELGALREQGIVDYSRSTFTIHTIELQKEIQTPV